MLTQASACLLRLLALAATAGVCVFFLACGKTHFDGTTFRRGDLSFMMDRAPSGWRSIDVSGALFAYRDDEAEATIAVNGRCGKDGDDVPLESLTQHLFIHFTDRELVDQRRMPLDGREVMRTEMFAKLDGVRRGFVVYVLKKDGCVYDFLYIGSVGMLEKGMGSFDRYVGSFRTKR